MIAKISFKYDTWVTREVLEHLAKLCQVHPPEGLCHYRHSDPSDDKEVEIKDGKYELYTSQNYEVDLQQMFELGIPFEVDGKGESNTFSALLDELRELTKKVDAVGYREAQYNEKVSVHIPGLAMMQLDTVNVLTNVCTDELQTWLDDGWRLLAICPQPDQRRPDYVLGRTGNDGRHKR